MLWVLLAISCYYVLVLAWIMWGQPQVGARGATSPAVVIAVIVLGIFASRNRRSLLWLSVLYLAFLGWCYQYLAPTFEWR